MVEEGIRRVLAAEELSTSYQLPDLSVGNEHDENPLDAMSWPELRDQIYGGR